MMYSMQRCHLAIDLRFHNTNEHIFVIASYSYELCIVRTFTCMGFSSVFHLSSLPELMSDDWPPYLCLAICSKLKL